MVPNISSNRAAFDDSQVVTSVEFLNYCDELYDIEVADNHNFYSGDPSSIKLCLTHNCAADVQSLLLMQKEQIKQAAVHDIEGKSYKETFIRHMLYQMSVTVHQLSILNRYGTRLDKKYMKELLGPASVLKKEILRTQDTMKALAPVKEANTQLLKDSGFKSGSLFGSSSGASWILGLTKSAHKQKLFFDVMGLKPVSKTKSGEDSVDSTFIDTYKDRNLTVSLFSEFQEASKLLSTYVKGFYKTLSTNIDSVNDAYLRASYHFFGVDTGRLASANPPLQTLPSRGRLAKIIKALFCTEDGYLLIRYDYSAHEVRCWSIVSGDKALASAFKEGQSLRQQWIADPSDAVKADLKKKGDLHIQNIYRFLGKWVEKSDPLRDAIKGVVFG